MTCIIRETTVCIGCTLNFSLLKPLVARSILCGLARLASSNADSLIRHQAVEGHKWVRLSLRQHGSNEIVVLQRDASLFQHLCCRMRTFKYRDANK